MSIGDPGPHPENRMTTETFQVRQATPADVPAIHEMIGLLADYEKLSHLHVSAEGDLASALFGERPAAEVLIACKKGTPVAFALFFHNFSTFLGRRGLWLEDLYVRPEFRRQGCAKALLRALAGLAQERGCGRFEWAVLDWNASAIEFYESLGATVMPDWRIVRVVGPSLAAMANRAD